MTERALWNAKAARDRLAAKISLYEEYLSKRKGELNEVLAWIAKYHEFAGSPPISGKPEQKDEHTKNIQGLAVPVVEGESEPSERRRATGNPKKEVVAEEALKIIEEAGEPVPRAELYRRLCEAGVVIEGKDPEQVLSTMLWRTRETTPIVRIPSGGYWLANRAHEPSGYIPERHTVSTPPSSSINEAPSKDVASTGLSDDAISQYMNRASRRYIYEISEDARAELLQHVSAGNSIPNNIQQTMLEYYAELADEDYQRGHGYHHVFVAALKEAVLSEVKST